MSRRAVSDPEGFSFGIRIEHHEPTDLGREVGRDEIDWWINRKEQDTPELRASAHQNRPSGRRAVPSERKAMHWHNCAGPNLPAASTDLIAKFTRAFQKAVGRKS